MFSKSLPFLPTVPFIDQNSFLEAFYTKIKHLHMKIVELPWSLALEANIVIGWKIW